MKDLKSILMKINGSGISLKTFENNLQLLYNRLISILLPSVNSKKFCAWIQTRK